MSYLSYTPTIKKKFCNHEYKILFPYGSRKATKVCRKCRKNFPLKLKSQKITKFMPPAFKQSEIDTEDKYRFLTNWKTFQENGFTLPGVKEKHDWCGIWQTKGCLHTEDHNGKIYAKQYKLGCFRAVCEECHYRWLCRQSNRSTRRIEKYQKLSGKHPRHIILSVPLYDYGLSLKELRKKARLVLREISCVGGAIIFHSFRLKNLNLFWSPHFHVIGFGIVKAKIFQAYRKYHWFIKDKGFRKSVFGTFHYNLDHCGIKKGVQALVWFGDLSYSKLKLEKEPDSSVCPGCGRKLVPIYYDGVHPVVPPEENFEGFVDSWDWYEVKTEEKSDWTKQDRYDYVLEKELFEANEGVDLGQ